MKGLDEMSVIIVFIEAGPSSPRQMLTGQTSLLKLSIVRENVQNKMGNN